MRDFVKIATDYAKAAVADKKRKKHGRLIREASKRFLDDLSHALLIHTLSRLAELKALRLLGVVELSRQGLRDALPDSSLPQNLVKA